MSGDLNKYEFLKRKDLKHKPNALNKAKFEFSPLGKAFSVGLDKTAQGYQEEGVIKLLKDIRDGLVGGNRRDGRNDRNNRDEDDGNDGDGRNDRNNRDEDDGNDGDDGDDENDDDDDNTDMPGLETEEEAKKSEISKTYDNYDDIVKNLKYKISDLDTKLKASKLSNEKNNFIIIFKNILIYLKNILVFVIILLKRIKLKYTIC